MELTEIEEGERQLIVRALAVQAKQYPGFMAACRQSAVTFKAVKLFDDFLKLLPDRVPPIQARTFGEALMSVPTPWDLRHFWPLGNDDPMVLTVSKKGKKGDYWVDEFYDITLTPRPNHPHDDGAKGSG